MSRGSQCAAAPKLPDTSEEPRVPDRVTPSPAAPVPTRVLAHDDVDQQSEKPHPEEKSTEALTSRLQPLNSEGADDDVGTDSDGDIEFEAPEEAEGLRDVFEQLVDMPVVKPVLASALRCTFDPFSIRPPFAPEPDLTPMSHLDVVLQVVRELLPGEVLLVGRRRAGERETRPFTPLVVMQDRAETARHLLSIFEAVTGAGDVPYWKLNPYNREAVEKHAGVTVPERWSGKALRTRKGTWVDEHVARVVFLSGDHDVGRTDPEEPWEKRLPFDDAVSEYWVKLQMLGAGPLVTNLQDSGQGFTPIWQLDPPMYYDGKVKSETQAVLGQLRDRARGLAVDDGAYISVNPFMKAPGAIHPVTSRTITFFSVTGFTYNIGHFHDYFEDRRPWRSSPAPERLYPGDPVPRRRRSSGRKRPARQRLGPSRAMIHDLNQLLKHWRYDLKGRSNAFFRAYAWHRRNILNTEVGAEASRAGEQLEESEFVERVKEVLRSELNELNEQTGRRIDAAKMNSYLDSFPKKPMSPTRFASDLKIDVALSRRLRLKTLLPIEEKDARRQHQARKSARLQAETDKKNKALDEMILNDVEYDYSKYSPDQVKYRRKRLIQEGYHVPDRRRGRRRKVGEGSPIDTPPNR